MPKQSSKTCHPNRGAAQVQLGALLALAVMLLGGGCAGYQIGSDRLYRPDIQTIYVPIFQSDSYRSWLGERLTEAVIKEIELRTPYKVVHTPQADSTLQGRIVATRKAPLLDNGLDEPRSIEFQMSVEVSWRNFQGDLLNQQEGVALPLTTLGVNQSADFIPEAGQSMTTAQQENIQRIARQIVGQMEMRW